MCFPFFKSLGIEHCHLQLLSPAKCVWAGLPLPGSCRAANTAACLKAEGTEGGKTGRGGNAGKRRSWIDALGEKWDISIGSRKVPMREEVIEG